MNAPYDKSRSITSTKTSPYYEQIEINDRISRSRNTNIFELNFGSNEILIPYLLVPIILFHVLDHPVNSISKWKVIYTTRCTLYGHTSVSLPAPHINAVTPSLSIPLTFAPAAKRTCILWDNLKEIAHIRIKMLSTFTASNLPCDDDHIRAVFPFVSKEGTYKFEYEVNF